MKINRDSIITKFVMIMIGTTIMAFAINNFFDVSSLVTGGFTGIAIIVREYFGLPLWLTNTVLNVPLFLLGIKSKGKKFLLSTLFATAFLSFALYFTKFIPAPEIDLTLAAVFGGALSGLGLGLVFSSYATTGGTDLAASILHKHMKHVSVSRIMFVMDSAIILFGMYVFGPMRAMYAIIAVFITSVVIDWVLEGLSFAKAAFIVSERSDDIARVLLDTLDRGVTGLHGMGMYTRAEKNVLLCVFSKREIATVKELVSHIDEKAFLIVADVREVLGEGFGDIQM